MFYFCGMYDIVKSLHIIFIVTWFAGLFYIVRLFIYHVEALQKAEPEKAILDKNLKDWEKRLWYIITWPSLILTLLFGPWLLYLNPALLYMGFMHIKLTFVGLLLAYHLYNHKIFKQLQNGTCKMTSMKLRIWNEVATLILVIIVFLIVMKNSLNWIYATVGFVLFAILLMLAIRLYKKVRNK